MQSTSPGAEKTDLLACHLCGDFTRKEDFLKKQPVLFDLILQSWRQPALKQYDGHIRKWFSFCSQRQVDPIHPTVGVAG